MRKSTRKSSTNKKRKGPARINFAKPRGFLAAEERNREQARRRREAALKKQIESKIETQPIPDRLSNTISNTSQKNSSFRNESFETFISKTDAPELSEIPPFDSSTHPPEFIDGISIDSEAGPTSTTIQLREDVVSISQNSTDDETKRKIIKSISGDPPEIISSIRLPFFEFSEEDIDDCIEVGQFERQIIKEALIKGLSQIASLDPSGRYTASKKEAKNRIEIAQKQTDAIADMLSSANSASSGLNILRMSPQIMQRASIALSSLLYNSETSKKLSGESLPENLDDYIKISFPEIVSVDEILTNTSRLILLMQDMLLSSLAVHPSLLGQFSRSQQTKTIFSIAENFSYDLDGTSQESDKIPTVDKVFLKSNSSISRAFIDRRVGVRPVTGLLNDGRYPNYSVQWDIITHLVASISNEMIISAGIGRLNGTQLGNKFLQTSFSNTNQYAPFDKVFGESPTASSETISKFFQTGLGRSLNFQGSFLDYMALGEEVSDRSFVVMPFEVDTIIDSSGTPYASGKKYFIDLALQETSVPAGTQPKKSSLKLFSNQFQSFTNDVSAYITEILALNVDAKLSPQIIFARILQDFREISKSISASARSGIGGNQSKIKSLTAAALFTSLGAGYQPIEINTESSPESDAVTGGRDIASYIGPVRVSSRDVLKMSVVKAYRALLEVAPDDKSTLDSKILSVLTSNELPELSSLGSGPDGSPLIIEGIVHNNLSNAWRIMANPDVGGIVVVDNNGAARYVSDRPGELLHDNEFDVRDNIVNLIAKTVREIEKEAYNLATRQGSTSDYRNSRGNTLMSDCSIDKLIDVVCEIYIRLSPMVLPFVISPISQDELRTTLRGDTGFTCAIDSTRAEKAAGILDLLVYKISRGDKITLQDIERQPGISKTDTIGVSITPARAGSFYFLPSSILNPQNSVGDKILNIAEIASRASNLVNHRYYIKSSLKIIESISQCVASSSSRISRIFDILVGSVSENLSESEKVLYDMFVTNISTYKNLLSNINSYQSSLCTAARYTQISTDSIFIRRDLDTTRSERLAVRDYIRSLSSIRRRYNDPGGDIHLMTVGIPAGTISAITSTSFGLNSSLGSDFRLGSAGTESSKKSPIISIDVIRHDQSRVTLESDGITSLLGDEDDKTRVYDPEIFILPDSISYNPSTLEPSTDPLSNSPGSIIEKILVSTKFYRIRSGQVIETVQGDRSLPTQYKNALVSYLLDLYMYDTIRVRYNDCLGPRDNISLSQQGYLLISEISGSPDLSRIVVNRQGFSNFIDPSTLKMKKDFSLLEMITKANLFSGPQFTLDNYKMAALLSSTNIISDISYILESRPYDRIYNFLYDENSLQNRVLDIEEKNRRKKMDIFTVSTSIRHIG